jgi:DNA-binding beta-propeller fold protein YncE
MTARRLTLALIAACSAIMIAVLASVPALALTGHVFSTSFGGAGEHALSDPQGVAIDQVTGEVYVVDDAHSRIEAFDSAGNFVSAFGGPGAAPGQFKAPPKQIAVDSSGPLPGDVYVLDGNKALVDVFNAQGEYQARVTKSDLVASKPPSGVGAMNGIAVDAQGNLWIDDNHQAFELQLGGAPVRFRFEMFQGVTGELALDPSGDLYAISSVSTDQPFLNEYDSAGAFVGGVRTQNSFCAECTSAVAVDPASGDVYVDRVTSIVRFPAGAGQASDTFGVAGLGALTGGSGMAVMGSTGSLYAADAARNRVDIFNPATLAGVTAEAPTSVTKVGALLQGVVNPAGLEVTSCQFEWGTEPGAYPDTVPCSTAPGAGDSPVSVSAEADLAPSTTYYYRLSATDADGSDFAPLEESFTTPPAVDALSTGPAEEVTSSAAKLTGSLSPDGIDTHYYFEYATGASYEASAEASHTGIASYESVVPALPGTDAGVASESVPAEATLPGLASNSVYHYRLVGVNSLGVTRGEDRTLLTAGAPRVLAESAEVKPSEKAGQTSATLGAQIDPDGRETTYQFEYGETSSYGATVPAAPGVVGSGEESVAVPATEVNGLKIGTTYHYRVVAKNEYGTVTGPDRQFTTLPAVLAEASVTEVTSTSATLSAQINPLGDDTSAYFQYGGTSCAADPGSCSSVPLAPGTDVGSGEADQLLSAHLQNLTPDVTYHYRVLAVNALGAVESEDRSFTTQSVHSASGLPDARAWEMVSPPLKQGSGLAPIGGAYNEGGLIQAARDGSALSYTAGAPVEENPRGSRAPETTQLLSQRSPAGWSTQEIDIPHDAPSPAAIGHPSEYLFFSSDLATGLVEPHEEASVTTLLSSDATEQTPYLRHDASCQASPATCYQPLVDSADVQEEVKFGGAVEFVGATPDLTHVVIDSPEALTSNILVDEGGSSLFEWNGGQLRLVSVLPNGMPATEAGMASRLGLKNQIVRNAISEDGSRVVWEAAPARHYYLRDMVRGETVQIDAAAGVPEVNNPEAQFETASSDDSRVFFTSTKRLTHDATTLKEDSDIYAYEVTSGAEERLTGQLTDLTVDQTPGEDAAVQGVIGASEDGASIYFVARGVLGDAAERGATAGNDLYVEHYDDGAKAWQQPRFIASLADADNPNWNKSLPAMTARVSPNGRYLAFMSQRSLTGYDNRDAGSGQPDEEVFLYDASTGRLVCASCDPTGARPVGQLDDGEGGLSESSKHPAPLVDRAAIWSKGDWLAALIPGWTGTAGDRALYQSRYLSDSGRLFFDSSDALVPQDANGTWDVYEYEPEGAGSCVRSDAGFNEKSNGCVGLVSSGGSAEESAFLDASETGDDVFFLTAAELAPQDGDNALDVYDAHACVPASPCVPSPPASPPPCSTSDACKAAPSPQPQSFGAPSSETFSGAGNLRTARPTVVVKSRSLTRAQKLARALRACHKRRARKRAACVRQVRRRYARSARFGRSKANKSLSVRGR